KALGGRRDQPGRARPDRRPLVAPLVRLLRPGALVPGLAAGPGVLLAGLILHPGVLVSGLLAGPGVQLGGLVAGPGVLLPGLIGGPGVLPGEPCLFGPGRLVLGGWLGFGGYRRAQRSGRRQIRLPPRALRPLPDSRGRGFGG